MPPPGSFFFHRPSGQNVQQHQHARQRDDHRLGHQAQHHEDVDQQIKRDRADGLAGRGMFQRRTPGINRVAHHCRHPEQPAEHVLALGGPGHRLGAQGMHRKDRRHHKAGPKRARHQPKGNKQEHRVGAVERHVHQMVPARPAIAVDLVLRLPATQAEELPIDHVGYPGQRMPVALVGVHEGPLGAFPGQSGLDLRLFIDVDVVVANGEIVPGGLHVKKGDQHHQTEGEAHRKSQPVHGRATGIGPRKLLLPLLLRRTARTVSPRAGLSFSARRRISYLFAIGLFWFFCPETASSAHEARERGARGRERAEWVFQPKMWKHCNKLLALRGVKPHDITLTVGPFCRKGLIRAMPIKRRDVARHDDRGSPSRQEGPTVRPGVRPCSTTFKPRLGPIVSRR